MNPLFLIDFYKVGHVSQYPDDTEQVWSNWTPRSSRVAGQNTVMLLGLQYFIKKYLIEEFNNEFFKMPISQVLAEYRQLIQKTLGVTNPKTDHIEKLHHHGYLPLDIYAIPEGDSVPLRVPQLVITNTTPDTFWLPNYFESLMSAILWKPCTSGTTAQAFRRLFTRAAIAAGETDFGFIDYQGHDFSFRGMSGLEDAQLSGLGHLASFAGTDTIPAIVLAHDYYHADYSIGGSVPATEHSVMCAGGKDGEFETFDRLINKIYPTGIVSIVSDTWDLWKVLTEFVPKFRETIYNREGKLVIRPDSGDPVNIICGDPNGIGPARKGVLRLLEEELGTDPTPGTKRIGLPLIHNAGAIYGDSITLDRARTILDRIVNELRLSPYNMVFGIGSYTYEYVTRDTYGFAMKATAVRRNGKIVDIFKKPVTDDGTKTSLKGIPAVYRDTNGYYVVDGQKPEALNNCAFRKVFSNGNLLIDDDFETIRKRARA